MNKIKTTVIVWISIYPTITFIQFLFGGELTQLPLPLRTFILTIVLVPSMVYFIIPFWTKTLNSLIHKTKKWPLS